MTSAPSPNETAAAEDDFDLWLAAGESGRQYWRDLWRYRELFYMPAWREVSVRYKQTGAGVAAALIRPFLAMVTMTVIFVLLAFAAALGPASKLMLAASFSNTVVISAERARRSRWVMRSPISFLLRRFMLIGAGDNGLTESQGGCSGFPLNRGGWNFHFWWPSALGLCHYVKRKLTPGESRFQHKVPFPGFLQSYRVDGIPKKQQGRQLRQLQPIKLTFSLRSVRA